MAKLDETKALLRWEQEGGSLEPLAELAFREGGARSAELRRAFARFHGSDHGEAVDPVVAELDDGDAICRGTD